MIDVDEEYSGVVVEKLTARRAELKDMRPAGAGKQRIVFHAPSRALIGYFGEFLTDTRGTGVLNRVFAAYEPFKGAIQQRHTGVLVSSERANPRPTRCSASKTAGRCSSARARRSTLAW